MSPDVSKLLELVFREISELNGTKIETFKPKDDFDAGGYYEFEEGEDGEPIPKICISAGNTELLKPLFVIRNSSIVMNAEMLGIDFEDMTPQLLQLFIIAHELGHIKDFRVNFEGDPDLKDWEAVEEMAYQRDAVLGMLPVPNLSPTHLARELEGLKFKDVIVKFPDLEKYSGFKNLKTTGDLLVAQEREYRLSAPESYADRFATEFLRSHADQLDIPQLGTSQRMAA